jgi:hypothetical protein
MYTDLGTKMNTAYKNEYPEFKFISLVTQAGLVISASDTTTLTLADGTKYTG